MRNFVLGLLIAVSFSTLACTRTRSISAQELAEAPLAQTELPLFGPLSELESLGGLYTPLGPRLGLIQVHSGDEWRRLSQVAPWLPVEPNWGNGSYVGLVSYAGQPIDGEPPVKLRYVRIFEGAGLVMGEFSSGSYLPDGSAYLTGTYVPGLKHVLLVEISDVRYRP